MKFFKVILFGLFLSVATQAFKQTETQPQVNYGLVTLQNRGFAAIEAKLIGPTSRTIRLGAGEDETVMVAPGKYYCLFRLQQFGVNVLGFYYEKEEEFTVTDLTSQNTPVLVKPSHWTPGKSITENEFNEFTVAERVPASDFEKPLDPSRLATIDVTVSIKSLYYANTEEQKKESFRIASSHMNDFVTRLLLPKLVKQGFKVNYLGLDAARKQPDRGLLVIDYDEQQGGTYEWGGGRTLHGVSIDCALKLMHPSITPGAPVWLRWLTAGNSFRVSAGLYTNALDNLEVTFKDAVIDLHNWAPRSSSAPAGPSNQNKVPRRRQPKRKKQ
jgi:hypothetical protein